MSLNTEQKAAIRAAADGHVAVIAGPGTGKTHTLISTILEMLDSGVPSENILALTFTTKAADELTARLKQAWTGRQPQVTTFHAWAHRQLTIALKDKKLMDAATQRRYMLELKKQTSSKHSPRELSLIISRCKNDSDTTAQNAALLRAYDELLARDHLIDFDDLLRLCLDNQARTPGYTHVLVDEFQDTSPLQYRLLGRFIENSARLFIIGDPNQSIYGFRGAGGEVFQRFITDYKPRLIKLNDNYRCASAIVKTAAGVFPDAAQQAVRKQLGTVQITETLDSFSEADYVIRTIEHALGGTDWTAVHHDEKLLSAERFRDFAVLYRHNRQGQQLAKHFRAAGLPVQVTGEDSPYATPLAQAILAALKYLLDPNEETKQQAVSAAGLLDNHATLPWLDTLDATQSPAQLTVTIMEYMGQADAVTDFQPVLNSLGTQPDLSAAVAYWHMLAEQDFYDPQADCITLSTIHASKGLEFRHVFVVGCNDDVLPHKTAIKRGDIAEEKRLFYVAITRAVESLNLVYCQQLKGQPNEPSRFLADLPDVIARQTDDQLAEIEKRRARSRQKRSQQTLF